MECISATQWGEAGHVGERSPGRPLHCPLFLFICPRKGKSMGTGRAQRAGREPEAGGQPSWVLALFPGVPTLNWVQRSQEQLIL